MRIIENNTRPLAPKYHFTCSNCKSIFEMTLDDLRAAERHHYNMRGDHYFCISLHCPACSYSAIFSSNTPGAAQYEEKPVQPPKGLFYRINKFLCPWK